MGLLELIDGLLVADEHFVFLQRVPNKIEHLIWIPGLIDDSYRPGVLYCIDKGVGVGIGGDNHSNHIGIQSAALSQKLGSGHSRHSLIGDDERDFLTP